MASGQNIDIVIKAIDEASETIKRVENQIANLATTAENSSKKTDKAVGGLSASFGGLGKVIGIVGGAAAAFGAIKGLFAKWSIAYACFSEFFYKALCNFEGTPIFGNVLAH